MMPLRALVGSAALLSVALAQQTCAVVENPLENLLTGSGTVDASIVPGVVPANLPFGLGNLTAQYTLTQFALYASVLPLILTACIKESVPLFTGVPSERVAAVTLGSAGFPLGRVCVIFGVTPDPTLPTRSAALNVTRSIFGPCPPTTNFQVSYPSEVLIKDYSTVSPAAVNRCPSFVGGMPAQLLGSAPTTGTLIPILDLPIPVELLSGVTTVDAQGFSQSFFANAFFARMCVHNVTRLSGAAGSATADGTLPPPASPGATAGTSVWWRVVFADPAVYSNSSTCALFARTPSGQGGGRRDDLVVALGLPGGPCPAVWAYDDAVPGGAAVAINATLVGFYEASSSGAASVRAAAGWWGALATGLLATLVAAAVLLPHPED